MTLWGGRFGDALSDPVWEFTTDDSDRRLLAHDVTGSIAHASMLGRTGIIDAEEAAALVSGLESILEEARAGTFAFAPTDEDVHTAVERRLGELVGNVAGKLHTGRSRNDQVALDLRLYLKSAGEARIDEIHALMGALADQAESHAITIVPSYTHLQQAQPTSLGHHLLAYAWMLLRDAERFGDAVGRIDASPLGAGASSGSSLPLDRGVVATALGLGSVMPNSLDAVASRDFVAEYVYCCAQTAVHLSRLAEDLVIWATSEFGWVRFPDSVVTGSSALPHKRNPDVAELVRGRSAVVIGELTGILALQKGLPLAYNRDMQEDKGIVFRSDDYLAGALRAMGVIVGAAEFDPPPPGDETVSLDLAEALVGRGVPFREAHRVVGAVIQSMEERGATLAGATLEDLTAVDSRFEEEDLTRLDPMGSVDARATAGSGNRESVLSQISQLRQAITNRQE